MKPILYESLETDFNHNGLGKMNETLSAIVTEVANGEFELEVVYPIGGRLYKHIQDHMFIKAKPNSVDDPHVFRIYEHTVDTVGQTVTIYAHTKSNDLGQNLVKDVVINSLAPQEAMNIMKMNLVEPTDYSFVSDITTRSSTEWKNRNPLNCIAGEEGSLIHYWGGEIKRDNRTIYLYRRRGRDNVAIIRDGKNINGLSLEYSTKGMVTKIIPYRTYTPEDSENEVVEYGTPMESQYIGNYPLVYVRAIDYSNDDNVTSLETMNTKASRYFTENNGVDKPSVNVSMGLVELSDSSEYEKFKDFENVELFDTVTVYSKQYEIHIEAKITTVEYDCLTGKNISLEMGSHRTGLIESTERNYMELIGEKEAKLTQTIQVAANGKNRVFRGVTEPTTGMVKNDIWYQPVGAGETMMYVFDGAYWQLNKVSAGLLGGTLDAENGDVNLINVNVANIVGETSDFVRSNWNNGIGGSVQATGEGVVANASNGSQALLQNGALLVRGADGISTGYIGFSQDGSNNNFTLTTANGRSLQIRYSNGDGTFSPLIEYLSYLDNLYFGKRAVFQSTVEMNGDLDMNQKQITEVQKLRTGILETGGIGSVLNDTDNRIVLKGTSGAKIGVGGQVNGGFTPIIMVDSTRAYIYRNLSMEGNDITNQSDERLKENIFDSDYDGLRLFREIEPKNFTWKNKERFGLQTELGFIAQQLASVDPEIVTQTPDDDVPDGVAWAINETQMNRRAWIAMHQLVKENDTLKQELADLKAVLSEKGLI